MLIKLKAESQLDFRKYYLQLKLFVEVFYSLFQATKRTKRFMETVIEYQTVHSC